MATLGGYFNVGTGTFFAPVDGVYYLSGYARCETSACDITLRLNGGTQVCGWGTDMVERINNNNDFSGNWYSTGCATVERLTLNQQISMWYESGESNDCMQDTTFHYTHLNVLLYMADGEVAAFVPGTQG